jgi:hypothetical protein
MESLGDRDQGINGQFKTERRRQKCVSPEQQRWQQLRRAARDFEPIKIRAATALVNNIACIWIQWKPCYIGDIDNEGWVTICDGDLAGEPQYRQRDLEPACRAILFAKAAAELSGRREILGECFFEFIREDSPCHWTVQLGWPIRGPRSNQELSL